MSQPLPDRPGTLRNFAFWLLAMTLGLLLFLLLRVLQQQGTSYLGILLLMGGAGIVMSALALPLLLPLLPWALGSARRRVRWGRALGLQVVVLALLLAVAGSLGLLGGSDWFSRQVPLLAGAYCTAGLVMLPIVYARWLCLPRRWPGGLPLRPLGI